MALALGTSGRAFADKRALARQAFHRGSVAYDLGRYDEAIAAFERAYETSKTPALLFDIAQANRLAGHCAEALAAYARYAERDPDSSNLDEVKGRIDEMKRCVSIEAQGTLEQTRSPSTDSLSERAKSPRAETRPASGTVAPPEESSPRASIAKPIWVIVASALVGVGGSALYLEARAKYQAGQRLCPCAPGSFDKWQRAADASYVLMAVGASGVVVGGSWLALAVSAQPAQRSARAPVDVSVSVVGRF